MLRHPSSYLLLLVFSSLLLFASLWITFGQAPVAQADLMSDQTVTVERLFDASGVEPLPDGCKTGLPPNHDEPVCCLSGFVFARDEAVKDATVTVFDAQGQIGSTTTQVYPGLEDRPFYYLDLTKLQIRTLGATRPITPGDVITLVASYSGLVGPKVRYEVQKGGQNLNFNPYDANALPLLTSNPGQAAPGEFQRIGDVTIDAQGNLYLWDLYNGRMQVFRLDSTGTWLKLPNWQREIGGQLHQVFGINGLAVNNDAGHVYLADQSNKRIAIYTTDGDFTGKVISATGGIASLDIDDAGNLYAYTYFEGIKKYNTEGVVIARNTSTFLQWDTIGRRLSVSPQGNLFYIKDTTNTVVKFAPDLTTHITFTLQLTSGLPLTRPSAIMIDDTNTLFVFNNQKARLFAFDATNGQALPNVWETVRVSPGGGKFLTYDQNHIYLISEHDGKIFQFSKNGGSPQKSWGERAVNHGAIGIPSDIAIAPDNSVWFVDVWTGRISRMVNNEIQQSWTMAELGQPAGIPDVLAFDRNGKLLVIDNSEAKIQRFRYEDSTLISDTLPWGGKGAELGKFCNPSGMDTDRNGYIYVTEPCNGRLQVVREAPTNTGFVTVTSISVLTATGALSYTHGVAVDDSANPTIIYVGDGYNRRIIKLSFDGKELKFVESLGVPTRFSDVFAHLDIDDQGILWVASNGYGVHRVNPNKPTDWQIYGSWGDPTWHAYGVAITKTTTTPPQPLLYVSSWSWGQISSFTPMSESKPIATITHLSAEDLEPGETLTAVGSGQDGDATNEILRYQWTFIRPAPTGYTLTITATNSQVTIPIVAEANQPDKLGPGLYTLNLRVQDNEGDWSVPVSRTIYVAAQKTAIPLTPVPTRDPLQPAPTPPATCLAGGKWTMLLYLDADNSKDGMDLRRDFGETVTALQQLNHPCLRVAVQIDGPPSTNITISRTERLLIDFNPTGAQPLTQTGWFTLAGVQVATKEADMDTPAELSDFIRWGQDKLPADHYYLAIADHGNGYQGIAFDHTSPKGEGWNAYLTISELRAALTAPGVLPIDVLHLDACSMALLDVAYEVRTTVDYLIASQYIGWSYFAYADYASYITEQITAKQLAELIVNRYARLAEHDGVPFTLSALDLTREKGQIEALKKAVDDLAGALKSWLNSDGIVPDRHALLFGAIRNQSQFFDSTSDLVNTPRDAYIDLKSFAERIKQVGVTDREDSLTPVILAAADKVLAEFNRPDKVVFREKHSAPIRLPERLWREGQAIYQRPINLDNANGISIYYPAEGANFLSNDDSGADGIAAAQGLRADATLTYTHIFSGYVGNQLFLFTRASRWDEFLLAAYGAPPITTTLVAPSAPIAPQDPATPPTPTDTPIPSPTATATATPLPREETPTPTATPTATPIADPRQIQIRNNTKQVANGVALDIIITNNSPVTLPRVALVQPLTSTTVALIIAAKTGCPPLAFQHVCRDLGDIPSLGNRQVQWEINLPSATPLPPLLLYVNGSPQPFTPDSQNWIYLPVVIKE